MFRNGKITCNRKKGEKKKKEGASNEGNETHSEPLEFVQGSSKRKRPIVYVDVLQCHLEVSITFLHFVSSDIDEELFDRTSVPGAFVIKKQKNSKYKQRFHYYETFGLVGDSTRFVPSNFR